MFQFIRIIGISWGLTACVSTRNFEEYALASAAMEAAKQSRAVQMSPSYYSRARSQFGIGLVAFQNKHYDRANEHFQRARKLAEKAELISYIKKSQGGSLY